MNKKIQRYTWCDALIDAGQAGTIRPGAVDMCLRLSKAILWDPKDHRPSGLYWKNETALEAVGSSRATYFRYRQELFDAGFFIEKNGNLLPQLPQSQSETVQSQSETTKSQLDTPYSEDTYTDDSYSEDKTTAVADATVDEQKVKKTTEVLVPPTSANSTAGGVAVGSQDSAQSQNETGRKVQYQTDLERKQWVAEYMRKKRESDG